MVDQQRQTPGARSHSGSMSVELLQRPRPPTSPLPRWLPGLRLAAVSVLLAAAALPAPGAGPVQAQTPACVPEEEPNDAPENAAAFAVPGCVAGTIPDGDQDIWTWDVSDAGAARPWTISLAGPVASLTTLTLVPVTSDPSVTPPEFGAPILELSYTPADIDPVHRSDVLVPGGRYLVGIARTTAPDSSAPSDTSYAVTIEPGTDLPALGEQEPNDDIKHATPVADAFALSADMGTSADFYRWRIGAVDATKGWTLDLATGLGVDAEISLAADDGTPLASMTTDDVGRLSIPDLVLPAGDHLLTLSYPTDQPQVYTLSASQVPLGAADPEPNDSQVTALPFDMAAGEVTGTLERDGDLDWYRLPIDEALAERQLDIRLLSRRPDIAHELCLLDADGARLQCRRADGAVSLPSLVLSPADHYLTVGGDPDPDASYAVRLAPTTTPVVDFELEPNDLTTTATPLEAGTVMRGRLSPGDDDYYSVTVASDPQLWQIDVTGSQIDLLTWVQGDGAALANGTVSSDQTSAAISDMYLEPGQHRFRVAGRGGEYSLALTPLGPPDPNAEREPNDDEAHAEVMLVADERSGRLPLEADTDIYRFSLAAAEHVLIQVEPPADGAIAYRLANGDTTLLERRVPATGETISYDAALLPGDYLMTLRPGVASSGRYHLSISRLDPFAREADQEPNDMASMARPFPASLVVEGTGTSEGDEDWYRLPAFAAGDILRLRYGGAVSGVRLSDGTAEIAATDDPESGTLTSEPLSSDAPLFVRVVASGDYWLQLSTTALAAVAPPGTLPVSLSLVPEVSSVAAYEQVGQRVPATITLANEGDGHLDLALDVLTSHYGWSVSLDQAEVSVPAGASIVVPASIEVAPDAWADIPVRMTVRARDAEGAQVTAAADVTPDRDVPPVGAHQGWPLPEGLLGGLDVASLAAGGSPSGSVDQAGEIQLHDGTTRIGLGFVVAATELPITLTVDLAGDDPVPVVGTILDPLARDASLAGTPRDFELRLSMDGTDYQTVLRGTLQPLMLDQPFVLDEPVEARWAQLVILSSYGSMNDEVALGEWKVVARPGTAPTAAGLDIADPLHGGHVVWMQPQLGDPAFAEGLLDENPSNTRVSLDKRTSVEWMIAFRADRAAQVTELQWVDGPDSDPKSRFDRVDVAASLAGPFGPWRELGTWQLERGADGTVAPMVLPEPVWARYLRFSAIGGDKSGYTWDMPATLRVIERASGPEYRTVLGEWGADSPDGPYEWLQPPAALAPDLTDQGDTPELADPLPAGERVSGRVHTGEDVDWYSLTVPAGQNTLELGVSGRPTVGVGLTLTDASGAVIPMLFSAGDDPGTVSYTAAVVPDSTYRVEVAQPPSSIVFTFDTSGSMGNYLAFVLQALRTFAAGVTPGQEGVLITPFEEKPLLLDWSDQPYVLQNAARTYAIGDGSSSAERALIDASTALSAREGARAILLVTDAETTSYPDTPQLWTVLGSVHPLIFAVHVGAASPGPDGLVDRLPGDSMRDWAASAGGFYQYTRTHGEMDRAFDRLATRLRRPASYGLTWTASFEKPAKVDKKPGSISVMDGADSTSSGSASSGVASRGISTEIILDTSGSMLERLGSRRKIDVARKVLTDLVTQRLPAGAPVALRVFGSGADTCGTSLAVPLSPLAPDSLSARIASLDVVQATDTPIGSALRKVPEDLADASGTRIIVLITDGQETCGGDPAAAVRALKAKGIDARVNIVGFGLSDRRLKKSMQGWARLGNGTYFDARDSAQLARAIANAVSAPFRVLDANGNEVAAGTVGGAAVKLPSGTYTVVALTDPTVRFEAVVVTPGKEASLVLPAADQ